jgi:colanic acid biosynthesis glycosyl transferase WcaI
MRVLFLSQYFFPEQFLNNHLARELAANGNNVTVVTCVPNYPSGRFFEGYSNRTRRRERWSGVDIHRVWTVARGKSSLRLVINFIAYPIFASLRIARMGRGCADISFVSMPSPLLQALAGIVCKKLWRVPTVYWVLDIWPDSAIVALGIKNRTLIRLLNALCGYIYRQADLVMVQSDGFHQMISRFGIPSTRIVTLNNFAPPLFVPLSEEEIPERVRRLIPNCSRSVMFAGNIGESQDFDTIIDAVKALPQSIDLRVLVVGSGRDGPRVEARIQQEGLEPRIVFLGRHPEVDMPAFFACADAMIVSLRDEKIFSLTVPAKVQAYLACGKPIIGSLAGEGAAVIRNADAGIVVPPSSPEDLCMALQQIATMEKAELQRLGRNARAVFEERFSLQSAMTVLTTELEAVLAGAKRSR